jgi:hypothetical protein
MNKELKRYIDILKRIRSQKPVDKEDMGFFISYTPDLDEEKIKKVMEGGEFTSSEELRDAVLQAGVMLQTTDSYKDIIAEQQAENQGAELSGKIAQGLNLLMGVKDIADSTKQINEANALAAKNKRPARPVVPQRDLYLQQALRSAQEGTFDSARAMAPVQAEIQDQYLTDMANAQTASTGQAGAFGAYAQLAANRRSRAAMNLAPVADTIRAREQQRYDNLLGARLEETQNMFQNQASLYPHELQQYRNDQEIAANLGATGRSNLRNSIFGVASQIPQAVGDQYAKQKYRRLRDQMSMYSPEAADIAVKNAQYLDQQFLPYM